MEKSYNTKHYKLQAIIAVGFKTSMGLTTWENVPDGKILKTDMTVSVLRGR